MPIVGDRGATLILLLILCFVLVSIQEIRIVKANSTIYIRADGSIEGTDKILRDVDVFIFSDNVTGPIFIEKDNVVVDGAGYTIIEEEGRGIVLSERNNVTVKNVKIEIDGGYGIYLVNSTNCIVSWNSIVGDGYNINLWRSFNNTLEGNTVTNAFRGILIYDSFNNTVTGNIVTDSVVGIELHDCINNVFRNNQMNNNRHNFAVRAYPAYRYVNDVDTSNTVDGAPIYYWVNEQDKIVPSNAGCVVLVNCIRITVQNLHLSKNGHGILLVSTTNSTLTQNTIISPRSGRGIELIHSSNNNIIENNVQNFSTGIQLGESSYNTIARNYVAQNDRGIRPLYSSINNTISENEIIGNDYGIDEIQEPSGNNIISRNTIKDNTHGISLSGNNIISENLVTGNSGFGIGLAGGSNTLTGNNVTKNGDGIYLGSSNNMLRNNRIYNNDCNFRVGGSKFVNDIDTSNTFNGNPIIYWVNQHDKIVPSEAGYVALVNCTGITVEGQNLAHNGEGILLAYTTDSKIIGNNIKFKSVGIRFYGASNNYIVGNNITNNQNGIYFSGVKALVAGYHIPSPNNFIYHNNFVNNQRDVNDAVYNSWWFDASPAVNVWDNSYISGGNYWSNYTGEDADRDEIGDTPYIIDEKNQDHYPLLAPINSFDAGIWEWNSYYVNIISNSTISDFHFNPTDGALIRFNVTGTNNTTGYCRVTIPKGLLYSENSWQVTMNGETVTPTIDEDTENTNLYFTYNHSTKTIEIRGTDAIPEFLSWIIVPLITSVSLIVLVLRKRLGLFTRIDGRSR